EVLEHDGFGTPIAHTAGSATFTFVPPKGLVPGLEPIITSPTHPTSTEWYSNDDPIFNWQTIDGVHTVGVEISTDDTPSGSFDESSFVDVWELEDVENGTHYIHVRFENDEGFGETGTFQFNVDTEAPYDVAVESGNCGCGNQAITFVLTATDVHSGVAYFDVYVDGQFIEAVPYSTSSEEAIFTATGLSGGAHVLEVYAVDRAGNRSVLVQHDFDTPAWWIYYCAYIALLLLILLLIALIVIWYQRRQNRRLQESLSKSQQAHDEVADLTKRLEKEIKDQELIADNFRLQATNNLHRAELLEEKTHTLEAEKETLHQALIAEQERRNLTERLLDSQHSKSLLGDLEEHQRQQPVPQPVDAATEIVGTQDSIHRAVSEDEWDQSQEENTDQENRYE
ncbi:MAG: hypothetical protein AAFO91_13950, partial [Bacteroidota bacterium]